MVGLHFQIIINWLIINGVLVGIMHMVEIIFHFLAKSKNGLVMPCHEWTSEEVEEDCKYVIDQLNEKYEA